MPLNSLFWLFSSLSGRLGRQPYLLAGLFILVIQMFSLYQVLRFPEATTGGELWSSAFTLVTFVSLWCNFALTAKRLHDFGRPTPFALVTLLFGYVVFILLAFFQGDPGPNRYGERSNAPA